MNLEHAVLAVTTSVWLTSILFLIAAPRARKLRP